MPGAVLFVTAVVVVVAKIRNRRRKKDLHKIPLAPGTLPVVGNLSVAKAFSQNLLHIKHAEFAEAAGEAGMLRVCVLGHTRVTLTTPATWAAVLRPGVFLPKPLAFYKVFSILGVKGIPLINEVREAEHARVRGHLMHALNADTVAASIWQLSDTVQRSIAAVTRCHVEGPQGDAQSRRARSIDSGDAASGVCWGDVNGQGVLVNMFSLAAANILSVVFRVFLEVDMTPPMAAFSDCLAHASSIAAHPALLPLMRCGLYPGRRRYRRNFDTLYAFHEELLARVYAKPLPEGSRTMWAALRRAYPDAMTDRHVYEAAISNLAFVYGASYETTANAAMHTLAALALDQDSQTAIVEELEAEGLLATPDNPEPRGVAAEDFSRLTVLDAVIHESLRLMPTAPNGGLRILTKDTTIGGLVLPKGTDVMMSSWSLHYNPHVWGDDAASWRPDRWLEGHSVAAVRKDADGLPRYQPFLIGPSNCVGQHLALAELKMIVVSVVSRLHVALDAERMGHMHSVEDYVRETVSRITLQRATPCWLRMKPRVEQRSAA